MPLLQDLLPELLEMIASYLDQASLATITSTCRRINTCCIPTMYQHVVLNDIASWDFYRSIEQNPQLAAHVQSITFDHGKYFGDHYADRILPKLPKVRHLHFFAREQDFFDRGMDEDENALGLGLWWPGPDERVPSSVRMAASSIGSWLSALRTCTLEFFSTYPEWSLERKAVLFLHPSLESLEIHHAYHGCDMEYPPDTASGDPLDYWRSPIFEVDPGPKSTNLRRLHFHLSDIDPQALTKILSFPRNLQHFTLTHHDFLDWRQSELRRGVDMVVDALRQQRDSLESLTLQGLEAQPSGTSLEAFSRLQILDIDLDMLFGEPAQEGDTTTAAEGPDLAIDWDNFLPITLQQLTLRCRMIKNSVVARRLEFLESLVADKSTCLPNLRHVFLVEEKLENESLKIPQELRSAHEKRLMAVLERLTSDGVVASHEVKIMPVDPFPPRLRELLGAFGNI